MKNNQSGFSLVELLVVVIIIAIIAAIAIPNLLSSRKTANEASAAANLRTIHSAQVTYFASTGSYGTLANLSDTANGNLLDASWTGTPLKNTYTYTLTTGTGKYCAQARSSDTTAKDYGVGTDGTIYRAAHGSADVCTGGALDSSFAVAANVLGAN